MIKQVVITDALLQYDGAWSLHPALRFWEKQLLSMQQRWFDDAMYHTPLTYFSQQAGGKATDVLLSCMPDMAKKAQQYWLVSPYHARLTRAELRVMPEFMLDWSEAEADQLCHTINPLLEDDGMVLYRMGCTLVLACDRVWDVQPEAFPSFSGKSLPNHAPPGKDAMQWMRLLTEIQMTLHQQPINTAQGLAVHGLWFWQQGPGNAGDTQHWQCPAVATRNVYLQSVLQAMDKEQGAEQIICEAEQLPLLLNEHVALPKSWVLFGEGAQLALKPSLLHRCLHVIRPQTWKGLPSS